MKSKYIERPCCTECDYFHEWRGFSDTPSVCPECGSSLTPSVGRYIFHAEKYMFGLRERNIITGFEKKNKAYKIRPNDKMPNDFDFIQETLNQ